MGSIWARDLPHYLEKWDIPYYLRPGWATRSRSSGGFDAVMGVGIHHDASSTAMTADSAFHWACISAPDKPIGNGSLRRDGVFDFWCAGAANTQGKGGPVHTSRGWIGLDNGNRNMFAIEADNNGLGERWSDAQIKNYPRLCCAVIEWANAHSPGPDLGPGDVFAHFEWTNPLNPYGNTRKPDPAGPSIWAPHGGKWNMDQFRGTVLLEFMGVIPPNPNPSPIPIPPFTYLGGEVQSVGPYRCYDSRDGGPNAKLAPGEWRHIEFHKAEAVGAHTVLVNLIATEGASDGFLTISGQTSEVNFKEGQTTGNLVAAPVRMSSRNLESVAVAVTGGPCHIIVDLQAVVLPD